MGRTQAQEMAGMMDLDALLQWHLQHNHYPPVPLSMIPVCKAAIEAANMEEWDKEVDLPEGATYQGRTTAPAREIIDAHHLLDFLEDDEDDEDDEYCP